MENLQEYNAKKDEIDALLSTTTGFEDRLELMDKLTDLKLQYGIIRYNSEGPIECIGCGS